MNWLFFQQFVVKFEILKIYKVEMKTIVEFFIKVLRTMTE